MQATYNFSKILETNSNVSYKTRDILHFSTVTCINEFYSLFMFCNMCWGNWKPCYFFVWILRLKLHLDPFYFNFNKWEEGITINPSHRKFYPCKPSPKVHVYLYPFVNSHYLVNAFFYFLFSITNLLFVCVILVSNQSRNDIYLLFALK